MGRLYEVPKCNTCVKRSVCKYATEKTAAMSAINTTLEQIEYRAMFKVNITCNKYLEEEKYEG